MPTTRRILLTAGVALGVGSARASAPVRGVIELFTSQGCSSCPPADLLLGRLGEDPGLVTLTLPVDYWDNLGWKDSFAQPEFTRRQRAYAEARGDGEIYTPQAVVNGAAIAVGSDRAAILGLLDRALPVRVSIEGGRVQVRGAPPDAMLIAAPFLRARSVAIGRGENANARVTYTNIVRDLLVLARVGEATSFALPALGDAEGVAVLVQQGGLDSPGRVLGAARA